MSRPIPLRFAFVLLALLPGLLLQGGESLRICLHDWLDYEDGCQESAVTSTPSVARGGGCCSEDRAPEGPARAGDHDCEGCCIDIGCDGAELTTPPPAAHGHALCPPAPLHHFAACWPAAPLPRLTPRTVVPGRAPPGRAPTPLRI